MLIVKASFAQHSDRSVNYHHEALLKKVTPYHSKVEKPLVVVGCFLLLTRLPTRPRVDKNELYERVVAIRGSAIYDWRPRFPLSPHSFHLSTGICCRVPHSPFTICEPQMTGTRLRLCFPLVSLDKRRERVGCGHALPLTICGRVPTQASLLLSHH